MSRNEITIAYICQGMRLRLLVYAVAQLLQHSKKECFKKTVRHIPPCPVAHCRGVLPRSSHRSTFATTRSPLPQLTTTTYLLYLIWHAVFLTLILTVVTPYVCLCHHREGRSLSSTGSIPFWGGGPSYTFSRVGQMSPFLFLYLTVMHCGEGLRMTSSRFTRVNSLGS